jgi:hypothetical protein
VFDRQGNFISLLGEGTIYGPRQICLDSSENVYVAGFHMAPDMDGLGDARPTWAEVRFLWVLDSEGNLLVRIGNEDADGLFEHGGGRHHAVTLSKVDESLLYFQAGHMILKYRILW